MFQYSHIYIYIASVTTPICSSIFHIDAITTAALLSRQKKIAAIPPTDIFASGFLVAIFQWSIMDVTTLKAEANYSMHKK